MEESARQFDFDWLVIGSGFGGSVSALRLAEKGYRVGVLECGRRFRDEDFATLDLEPAQILLGAAPGHARDPAALDLQGHRRRLRLRRRRRQPRLREHALRAAVAVLPGPRSGATWPTGSASWRRTTPRRSGCSASSRRRTTTPPTSCCSELGEELGVGDTYRKTPVGIFFGEQPGATVPDPYFGGEGPDRTGCMQCGRCMVGCPHGAKNTLVKNYLWLAEQRGVTVTPDRTVIDVRPLGAEDGSDGYAVTSVASGMRRDRDRRRSRPAASSSRPARSAPTDCCSAAACPARCRASRTASASSCARTASRSSPSPCPTTTRRT